MPPYLRVTTSVRLAKAWKSFPACFRPRCRCPCRGRRHERDAGAGRGSRELDLDSDLALLGELHRVADEVDEHLPQPAGSPTQRVRHVGRDSPSELQPLLGARARERSAACRRPHRAGRMSIGSSSSLPASIFEKSRMSLMSAAACSAETVTIPQVLALLGGRARCSSSSSVMPSTPFIGVRISWLMLARNSLFARLAASAASFATASW